MSDINDNDKSYFRSKVSHLESGRSEQQLLCAIEDDAFSLLSELGAPPPRRIQQTSLKAILAQLENMKNYVDSAVDTRLDFYIEVRFNSHCIIHIYIYCEIINNEKIYIIMYIKNQYYFTEDSQRIGRSAKR